MTDLMLDELYDTLVENGFATGDEDKESFLIEKLGVERYNVLADIDSRIKHRDEEGKFLEEYMKSLNEKARIISKKQSAHSMLLKQLSIKADPAITDRASELYNELFVEMVQFNFDKKNHEERFKALLLMSAKLDKDVALLADHVESNLRNSKKNNYDNEDK